MEIGTAIHGYGGLPWSFDPIDRQVDGVTANRSHRVKLLVRSSFVEFYVDGRLVQSISMSERFQGLGLLVECGSASFSGLTIHRMALSSIEGTGTT